MNKAIFLAVSFILVIFSAVFTVYLADKDKAYKISLYCFSLAAINDKKHDRDIDPNASRVKFVNYCIESLGSPIEGLPDGDTSLYLDIITNSSRPWYFFKPRVETIYKELGIKY